MNFISLPTLLMGKRNWCSWIFYSIVGRSSLPLTFRQKSKATCFVGWTRGKLNYNCLQMPSPTPPPSPANTVTPSARNRKILPSQVILGIALPIPSHPIPMLRRWVNPTSSPLSLTCTCHDIVKQAYFFIRRRQSGKITCFGIRHTWVHGSPPTPQPPISHASPGLLLKLGSSISSLPIHMSIHSFNK